MAKRARIKQAKITYLSLCPKGKNGMRTLFKADENQIELQGLAKADETGMLTAVVYAPNLPDKDGHEATAEVIAQMAKEYVRDHRNIDLRHDLKTLSKEDAYLAHSWIITKAEVEHPEGQFHGMVVDGKEIDPTGGWAVGIQIDKESLRKEYRTDAWGGVSMFGDAVLEVLDKGDEDVADRIVKQLAAKLQSTEDTDMDAKEFAELITKANESLVENIVKALKPEKIKKEEGAGDADEVKPAVLTYSGDGSPESLQAFLDERKRASLVDRIQKADTADELEAIQAELAEMGKDEPSDDEVGIKKADSVEVKGLKRKLHKAQSASTQKVTKSDVSGEGEFEGLYPEDQFEELSKEDASEGRREALLVSAMINDENGQELSEAEKKALGRS